MNIIHVDVTGKGGAFAEELKGREIVEVSDKPIRLETLDGGMTSGAPSVGIMIDLPDGRVLLAQTSVRLFLSAAAAMRGRYGDL